jgi:UDP-GlcNAc:undecaprenyl-phosphate GlcNAc-1-phosphate transferase
MYLIYSFLASLLVGFIVIKFKNTHSKFTTDQNFLAPQSFHTIPVPRIGGLCIFIGLLTGIIFNPEPTHLGIQILLCSIPAFFIGLLEDITKKIGVRTRLFLIAISSFGIVFFLEIIINKLGIPYLDILFFHPLIAAIFTMFAITGLTNSYNIIDGFNGLASMIGIITLSTIIYVAYINNDYEILFLGMITLFSILGFFAVNFPRGLIFLGDCGAYLIGFWNAVLSILLVQRHPEVSPWFALLINLYPIFETIFSIYRRNYQKNKHPYLADGLHLHTLIFRRVVKKNIKRPNHILNSSTSVYIWLLDVFLVIPALLFWNNQVILIIFVIIFIFLYLWLYSRLVYFLTPNWLHF